MEDKTNIELIYKKMNDLGVSFVFENEDGRNVCLPSSQITFDICAKCGDVVDVEMPLWLARNEGLDDD